MGSARATAPVENGGLIEMTHTVRLLDERPEMMLPAERLAPIQASDGTGVSTSEHFLRPPSTSALAGPSTPTAFMAGDRAHHELC